MRLLSCLLLFPIFGHAATLQETWEMGYTQTDASGPQVLGYWKFDADAPLKDASVKGHDLTLQGAVTSAKGKFGGALESFPGFPVEDKRHAAMTAVNPAQPRPPKGWSR